MIKKNVVITCRQSVISLWIVTGYSMRMCTADKYYVYMRMGPILAQLAIYV